MTRSVFPAVGMVALATILALGGCTAAQTPVSDTEPVESAVTDSSGGDGGTAPHADAANWGCEDYWLEAKLFDSTARTDLFGASSLPPLNGRSEVTFVSPAICVIDSDLGDVGTSRTFIFDDGMPEALAAAFEASGWDGDFGTSAGYASGSYKPTDDNTLAWAQIDARLFLDGRDTLSGGQYVLVLTTPLVELYGG